MSYGRDIQMTEACTITRNPSVGGSGITAVASDLACTPAYPSNLKHWNLLSTDFKPFDIYLDTTDDAIQQDDILTMNGKAYTIAEINVWLTYTAVLIKERT